MAQFHRTGTDHRFGLHLAAYEGDPAAFPRQGDPETFPISTLGYNRLAFNQNFFEIGARSWQGLLTETQLPAGTDFFVIILEAFESSVNDVSSSEFAGQYADQVEVALDTGPLPPVASDDAATIAVDTSVSVQVLSNDDDVDGTLDPTTVAVTQRPGNGTATPDVDGLITYTPNIGFSGLDTFHYTVADDEGAVSNEATVTVTVLANNIPPVARADTAMAAPRTSIIIDVLANDSDADGTLDPSTLLLTMGNLTSSGLASTFRTADFKVGYTVANFTGTDTFTYTVADDEGAVSNEATVSVIVQ